MYENQETEQRALLVAVDTGEFDAEVSLAELAELARTAGAYVVARVCQRRAGYEKATLVGSGRLQEIKELCVAEEIDLLLFDHELSASQIRNISEVTGVDVVDRTMLILDIFAQRAHSGEGRLQVELAQQRYRLPRLSGLGSSLSRLGGGIGTRGPGETKLESDRRHIRRRIQALEEQLEQLTRHRNGLRERRRKDGLPTVAIVGYTNVGKSTLMDTLTDAGVLVEDKLFATLDPTARALLLPDGRTVMLVDTVGLVRRLPHHLVEAFQSTLEEAAGADLLLNVCDASSGEAREQLTVTQALMEELGAAGTPMLTVMNKCDLLTGAETLVGIGNSVPISAQTGMGLQALLAKIAELLTPTQVRMTLEVPYAEGPLVAQIRALGRIYSEEFTGTGTKIDALVDRRLLHLAQQYQV